MPDAELEAYLFEALLEDWPGMPVEKRLRYIDLYPERVARAGVSLDDPHVPIPERGAVPETGWRPKPMTPEELEAAELFALREDWPTMPSAHRRHYANLEPQRVAEAGLSIDDPYKRRKEPVE